MAHGSALQTDGQRGGSQATRKSSSTSGEWWVGRGLREPCALMESIRIKLPAGESTRGQVGSPEPIPACDSKGWAAAEGLRGAG